MEMSAAAKRDDWETTEEVLIRTGKLMSEEKKNHLPPYFGSLQHHWNR